MPASVAEEHVEGIGAVLARLAGSSCSPFQIELLLDVLETLPARALACASAPRSTSAGAHVWQTTRSPSSRPRCGPSSPRPTARPSELLSPLGTFLCYSFQCRASARREMRERVDRFVFLSGFLFCGARVAFSLFMSRETVNSSPYPGSNSKSAQSTPTPARPRGDRRARTRPPCVAVIASEGATSDRSARKPQQMPRRVGVRCNKCPGASAAPPAQLSAARAHPWCGGELGSSAARTAEAVTTAQTAPASLRQTSCAA